MFTKGDFWSIISILEWSTIWSVILRKILQFKLLRTQPRYCAATETQTSLVYRLRTRFDYPMVRPSLFPFSSVIDGKTVR